MNSIYAGAWENKKEIEQSFHSYYEKPSFEITGNIIFAIYDREEYEGRVLVVFEKDNVIYEVNASHCSCYGLEGQWSPEETTKEALLVRFNSTYPYSIFGNFLETDKAEIKKWLEGK